MNLYENIKNNLNEANVQENYDRLSDEDKIAEDIWHEASKRPANTDDEKLDQALRMAVADEIGYITTLSNIINTARYNYFGDKTDEEIAPLARMIANEYGLEYEDDMLGQDK